MCRLETCREPARATGPKPSKYCCDEHGAEFMRLRALKGEPEEPKKPTAPTTGRRKGRKDNYTDNFGNSSDLVYEEEDDDSHVRGGVLRPAELKTLANTAKSITEFRNLGEGVLSPPQTVSPDGDISMSDAPSKPVYTPEETQQLAVIISQIDALKQRKQLLDDRDILLSMIKGRAKSALDELKKKEKNAGICGFDARLTWTDEEFQAWRSSPEGQETFKTGQIKGAAASIADPSPAAIHEPEATNGVKEDGKEENKDEDEATRGMCTKRRCKRHETWQRLQTQEVAFEKDQVRQEMRRLIAEEKGVRERAAVRGLEE